MIKVCHIVNLITGNADGVYTHLKMIFRNADKTKFQHYLIYQGGENIEKEAAEIGVKVFVSTSLKKKISIRAFADIYRVIKENNIDIVHAHLIKPYAITGFLNILLKKKFIFNYHGIFIANNPYYSIIEKLIYSMTHHFIYLFGKVDIVLVPSEKSKRLLMNETKLFPKPVVYYNGYSINRDFPPANVDLLHRIEEIKKDKIVIALIGRLEIDKRIDRAINLINNLILHEKNIHLIIFGDGQLKSDLHKLIDELELNEYVDLPGYVRELQNYYKFIDIVLFTSDWEGMPLTMWEAMANGIPVLAPDVGGLKEILEENNCGIIYELGNLEDAEEKITKLLYVEKLRKKLGANGKSAIEIKYNEKNFITHIEQIYLNLLPR